jgi:hypothetical protein
VILGPQIGAVTDAAVASATWLAYIIVAIAGTLLVTTEFQHHTARPTFLAQPLRGRVVLVKAVAALMLGLFYGMACAVSMTVVVVAWSSANHLGQSGLGGALALYLLRSVFVMIAFALLGAAVGLIVRSQLVAVVGLLLFIILLDQYLAGISALRHVYPILPTGAVGSLLSVGSPGAGILDQPLTAMAVLVGWVLIAMGIGWLVTTVVDIS